MKPVDDERVDSSFFHRDDKITKKIRNKFAI